ncbi:MAG: CBS domain-containing protein [Flavobacteriaceae bacterium TMED81]|nr:MAG: CBS domain-containing protein [Flavobacteriaceae bacterium TMED81]
MIKKLKKITVRPEARIREVMEVLDSAAHQIALVTNSDDILIATVTDGDIRRGLLKGVDLNAPVSEVMNRNPMTLIEGTSDETAWKLMRERGVGQIPIVDTKGRLVSVTLRNGRIGSKPWPNRVILMAGGLGVRLHPLTEKMPKPMLPVAGKPLLERIITRFKGQGFRRFTLSLNYLGHVIKDHFGDGATLGVRVDYIEETTRMGTGGALSILPQRPEEPFIVMNGDILTTVSFSKILEFHNKTNSIVTICTREFNLQVPYGVLNTEGNRLVSMEEKPVHKYLINAGIYALSPVVFEFLQNEESLDLPDLIERVRDLGHRVSVFHISGYWMDIGSHKDLERARADYEIVFEK